MAEPGRQQIGDFRGVAKNYHTSRLPDGLFIEDVGGDRFDQGVWKVRKGRRHTTIPQQTSPIEMIIGFALPGGDYPVAVGADETVSGFSSVSEQTTDADTAAPDAGGFGVGGFGEGDFGD
jgi:hypothetical protein